MKPLKPSQKKTFFFLQILFSIVIIAGILYYALTRIRLSDVAVAISHADIVLLMAAIGVLIIGHILKGVRWAFLVCHRPSFREIAHGGALSFLAWFINFIIPARAGDFYRMRLTTKIYNTSYAHATAASIVEKTLDVLLLIIASTAFYLLIRTSTIPPFYKTVLILVVLIFLCGVIGLVLFGFIVVKTRLRIPKVGDFIRHFFQSLRSMNGKQALIRNFFLTCLIWLGESLFIYLLIHSLHLPLSYGHVVLMFAFLSLLYLIPLTPGGLGIYDVAFAFFLTLLGFPPEVGVGVVLLQRSIEFAMTILIGIPLYYTYERFVLKEPEG